MIKLTDTELDNFVWTPQTPAQGMIVNTVLVIGGSLGIEMMQHFETEADRDAFLALIPKSYRIKTSGPTTARSSFYFASTGTTGDVNESAAKRLRSILKKLDKLGVPVTHLPTRLRNEQPSIDEVLAMIDEPIKVAVS